MKPEHAERPVNCGATEQNPTPQTGVHKHVEAFRLMLYSSKDGKTLETIWNTRDGVTPFICASKDGKEELRHVMWGGDPYAPHHVPNVGDRVFVDLSQRDAEELAWKTVERYWNAEEQPWCNQFASKQDAFEQVRSELCKPGAPTVVTVNAALQQAYLQKRSETTQLMQRRLLDRAQGVPPPQAGGAQEPRPTTPAGEVD